MASLAIASAQLYFVDQRKPESILNGDVDLRPILQMADRAAVEIVEPLFTDAGSTIQGMMQLKVIVDTWLSREITFNPINGEGHPWVELPIPSSITPPPETEASAAFERHRSLHVATRFPALANHDDSTQLLSPSLANFNIHPSYLVKKTFLDRIPQNQLLTTLPGRDFVRRLPNPVPPTYTLATFS
ncbi:hypothetical protein DXG01_015741 [Tephrocybe rancida]|nr:hypothetical protein DXG01_015741 [Tephrocybe rancida]